MYPSVADLRDSDLEQTVDLSAFFATLAQDSGLPCDFGLRQPQKLGFLS